MTIVHRNNTDSGKRSYATIAAIPAIIVPAPIAIQNSFSVLKDDSSDSDIDMKEFEWSTVHNPSESNMSDTIEYDSMTSDSVEESSKDNSRDNSEEDSGHSSSEQDELIVNHKHYHRVRQTWCKGGVPCFVTSITVLLGFAYFMQFVFYMCGLVNDDCCSPVMQLQCSKGHKGL